MTYIMQAQNSYQILILSIACQIRTRPELYIVIVPIDGIPIRVVIFLQMKQIEFNRQRTECCYCCWPEGGAARGKQVRCSAHSPNSHTLQTRCQQILYSDVHPSRHGEHNDMLLVVSERSGRGYTLKVHSPPFYTHPKYPYRQTTIKGTHQRISLS